MDNPLKPLLPPRNAKYDELADLPSCLDFDYRCSKLQWSLCGWTFNHQFLTVNSRRPASIHGQHCFLSAWHSAWNTVAAVVDCIHGLNLSFLLYSHPLPSDFAVCPIKEAESVSLPLGLSLAMWLALANEISAGQRLEERLNALRALEIEAHLLAPQLLLWAVHAWAPCLPQEEDEKHMEQRRSTRAKPRQDQPIHGWDQQSLNHLPLNQQRCVRV